MATKMTWDSNADAQLLLAIIAEQPVSLNFDSVASRMGCTPRAIQERLKKLKKLAAGPVEGTLATPSKRISKKANEDAPTPKKRKATTPRAQKSPKNKSAPVKEEQGGPVVSGEESGTEDSSIYTQASIKAENEAEDHLADSEANLEDMDIQMLLTLQKICNQKAIKLPWDEVGAQLGGTITGGAIIQHLAKIRARRVEQGLPVPEPLKRGSGGSISLSSGAVNDASGARKGRRGKRTTSLSINTSNEDDEEEFDVDKASDPEASFGEVRKKRVKREIEDENDDDEYGMLKKPKGGQSNKNSKAAKRIKTDFAETTKQNLREESSPEASSVTDTERAGRRTSVNYARLHNGESEYDTDDEINEPHVAAGSSFLRLEGVPPIGHKKESVNMHDEVEFAQNDEDAAEYVGEASEDASMSPEQDNVDSNNITVLRLGKSDRSLDFLKALDSSYPSPAPLGYVTSAVGRNVGYLPPNVSRRASMDFGINSISRAMTNESFDPQYFPSGNGMNFRIGHHSQYNTGPYPNTFLGSSSAPYNSAMPGFMPLTPVTGQGFTGLPEEFFGNNIENLHYHNSYGSGRSVQSITAPQTPVIGGGFSGQTEYAPRAMFSNILPSNALQPSASPSQIMRSYDFPSLSNTRNNSVSTSVTTNGQQNSQDYAQNNNQTEEVDLTNGEQLTNIYSFPNSEQHDPIMGLDMGLDDEFLGSESFGAAFDRLEGEPDGHNF
ncbi:hypothetical protein MMC18_000046 [Xylographa bjoerkii]|nr:hypothetical protein [Xylographa bjoerkii]